MSYGASETHVATLIAPPSGPVLNDEAVDAARALLAYPGPVVTLDPGKAVDLFFLAPDDHDDRVLADRLRAAAPGCDVVVQAIAGRRKRILIADMDSTMIGQECIDELADLVGLKEHVSAITERAMRGEIDFEPALRERVALLKGLNESVIAEVIARRITFTRGGRTLVRTMRAHGGYCALVSGGFSAFTGPISLAIGFDEHRANVLLVDDARLVGRVAEPILGREAKRAALLDLSGRFGIPLAETMAVGDGANDLAMIEAAGLGVAFHAKPKVAEAAGARIDHGDLTALLFAQGYRRAEFVAG